MKIDVNKSEKENVHDLIAVQNPLISEKLKMELVSDSYVLDEESGNVQCTVTEHDINDDGFITKGSVVINYKRVHVKDALKKLINTGIELEKFDLKNEIIQNQLQYTTNFFNKQKFMVMEHITLELIKERVDYYENDVFWRDRSNYVTKVKVKATNSLLYYGETFIEYMYRDRTGENPNEDFFYKDLHKEHKVILTFKPLANNEFYKTSCPDNSSVFNYSKQIDPYMYYYEKELNNNYTTFTKDDEKITARYKNLNYFFKRKPAELSNDSAHMTPRFYIGARLDVPKLKNMNLITLFPKFSPVYTNSINDEEKVFVLEESALLDYIDKYKLRTDRFSALNVFTYLDNTNHFDEESKLHVRLAQCGIDPYLVGIKVKSKLDTGETLDHTYGGRNIGYTDKKPVFEIELELRDSEHQIYNSIKPFQTKFITLLEEILNPYVGGYRCPVPLIESIHFRREFNLGNSDTSVINNLRANTNVTPLFPLIEGKESQNGPLKLKIVDYNFHYRTHLDINGVFRSNIPTSQMNRDFFYTYLQQLVKKVGHHSYPPTASENAFGSNTVKFDDKLFDIYKYLTTTNTGHAGTGSTLKFNVKNVEITPHHDYPMPTCYDKYIGEESMLFTHTEENATNDNRRNVFNVGTLFFNDGYRLSATGYFKITGQIVIENDNSSPIVANSFDRSGKFEFYMAMPNFAMIMESYLINSSIWQNYNYHAIPVVKYPNLERTPHNYVVRKAINDPSEGDLVPGQLKPLFFYRSYGLISNEDSGQIEAWLKKNGWFRNTKLSIVKQFESKILGANLASKFYINGMAASTLHNVSNVFKFDLADAMLDRENHSNFISNIIPTPVYYLRA